MIKATWHGHGCYAFEFGDTRVIIDPFLSDSPTADIGPDDVEADYILLTHGHSDHFGDTVAIGERTGATVVAPNELAVYCGSKGLTVHPMYIGGGWDFPFGRVELTIAHHGSALVGDDGIPIYLGNPCGFLINSEGKTIYFAGDTGLFLDMKLIGDRNRIDLAILPTGDNFTMGVEAAITAAQYVKPKVAIPMHFGTWPLIDTDPNEFVSGVEKLGIKGVLLEIGGSYTLE
ncbi:metal-dependent hydrolase [Gemmatimonadota bacterium]